jgi:ketosteroid isomerase-like protein
MWRAAQLGVEAYNRRDPEAVAMTCHPDFEYHPARKWVEAGLVEPCYRGLAEYRKYLAGVDEVWGGHNHLTPTELIDLGDRLVMLSTGTMRARASGVPLTEPFALVSTLKDGRSFKFQEYYDHAEALEAVGLSD